MEDSGIDSDSKPSVSAATNFLCSENDKPEENVDKKSPDLGQESSDPPKSPSPEVVYHGVNLSSRVPLNNAKSSPRLMPTSLLQKRLEKQIMKTRKQREQEQSHEGVAKKLISRSRLKVPKGQAPVVDSHPLVSWDSDSEDDLGYHPISKSTAKEITEQLIKDGYNLDLTPDDEDLDLIPPKPLADRCVCCSVNCTCTIQ